MENVGAFLMLLALAFLAFAGFVIYFVFKMLEFVIRAINLYEKMVNRQDAMIKLLMQLRNAASGGQDVQPEPDPVDELRRLESGGDICCPVCNGALVDRAPIEDGSIGQWCPKCKKSVRRMQGKI